jgi:hypothetical protein
MKKMTIALGLLLATALSTQAQEKSFLVYGGLDGGGGEFKIDAGVGYQFDKNLTAGINIMSQSDGYAGGSIVDFEVGPFVRYTKSISPLFSIYGQANFGFGSGTKTSTLNLGIVPGVQMNIKNGWAIYSQYGNIGWSRTTINSVSTSATNFSLGRGMMFGIQKNIGSFSEKK